MLIPKTASDLIENTQKGGVENAGAHKGTEVLLDEEQEKEMEQKLEERGALSRPPADKPCTPILQSEFKKMLRDHDSNDFLSSCCSPLTTSLAETSVPVELLERHAWDIKISTGFVRTVESGSTDDYLHPVSYSIVVWSSSHAPTLILLAPHEVDFIVRKKATWQNAENITLHMFVPSMTPDQADLFAEVTVTMGRNRCAMKSSLTPLHAQLSVFAMSLFYDASACAAVERFLCLPPRPLGGEDGRLWDALRNKRVIDDNKFVHPASATTLLASTLKEDKGLKTFLGQNWAPTTAYELAIRLGSNMTNLDRLNGNFGFARSPLLFLKHLERLRQVSHQVKRTHYAALMH